MPLCPVYWIYLCCYLCCVPITAARSACDLHVLSSMSAHAVGSQVLFTASSSTKLCGTVWWTPLWTPSIREGWLPYDSIENHMSSCCHFNRPPAGINCWALAVRSVKTLLIHPEKRKHDTASYVGLCTYYNTTHVMHH